ncbi:MAG: response regulator transcription factor, partial [Myxococcota bacterium]
MDNEPAAVVTVAIADKNPLLRIALEQLFNSDARFDLVSAASNGEEFVEHVERERPDVGVVGWVMPRCDGARVLERLRSSASTSRIVVYTGDPDPYVPKQVKALGGAGFCSKSVSPETLVETVLAVAAGRSVFPFVDVSALEDDPMATLTGRERDLLAALSSGRTNAELGVELGVSVNTVK